MIDRAHVDDLVDGFLLGALEPDESDRVRTHLMDCADCGRALAESRAVIGVLPSQLDELTPRASVRASLLVAIQEGRDVGMDAPVVPLRMKASNRRSPARWIPLGMAAALAIGVIGGLAAWSVVLSNRLDSRDSALATRDAALDSVARSQALLTMRSTFNGLDVNAAIAVPADASKDTVVVVSDLPAPTTGNAYHLWVFSGGKPEYLGVLSPDTNGDVVASLRLDVAKYDHMEVDLQPVTATAPGGQTVIGGALN